MKKKDKKLLQALHNFLEKIRKQKEEKQSRKNRKKLITAIMNLSKIFTITDDETKKPITRKNLEQRETNELIDGLQAALTELQKIN